MDGRLSPGEKLECVKETCHWIFKMLQLSDCENASADDFLPCLIYVCLKANPCRLNSNINYISRFRNEEKLRMGETGYYFASLVSVLWVLIYVLTMNPCDGF